MLLKDEDLSFCFARQASINTYRCAVLIFLHSQLLEGMEPSLSIPLEAA